MVTARAGSGEAKEEVDVAEGEKKDVALVLVAGGEKGATRRPRATRRARKDVVHTPGALTYGGIVVGGAGLLVGAVTGIMTLSKASTVKTDCTGGANKMQCTTPDGTSALNAGNTLGAVSTVSFVVAGVGAGVAIVSLIVGHKPAGAAPASAPPADPDAALRTEPVGRARSGVAASRDAVDRGRLRGRLRDVLASARRARRARH